MTLKRSERSLLTLNLLYLLIPILIQLMPLLFLRALGEPYGLRYTIYLVLSEFISLLLPLLVYLALPCGQEVRKSLFIGPPGWATLLILPLSVCSYLMANGVTVVWFTLLSLLGAEQFPASVATPETADQLLLSILIIAVVPAICEELFFRGALLPRLCKHMPPWLAVGICGCLFGLIHGQLAALPAHLLLGILFSFVAYRTRSVYTSMLWHAIQNGLSMLLSYFSSDLVDATAQAESATLFAEQPLLTLFSGMGMTVFFGALTAGLLGLFFYCTRSHRRIKPLPAVEPAHPVCYLPYAPAMLICLTLYTLSTIDLFGGMLH